LALRESFVSPERPQPEETPRRRLIFRIEQPFGRGFSVGDVVVLIGIAVLIYAGMRLALQAPETVAGPTISLSPRVLPYYALRSVGRMAAAYLLSLAFTLVYGRLAAYNRRAEQVLMPLLDVLQSVPILSFLPVVLLSLSAILPERAAAELASIVLIFTSQAWNMTFAWYQSLTTIPVELREASAIFRFNGWLRFKVLELPFAAISLIWNSMMSWAGGWFFLMAAEIFTVGQRDFRLPGLGAYLQEAANQGDTRAILWGIGTLVLVIVALDQLVWRPLLAWADRFKLETVEGENPPTSWFYDLLRSAHILERLSQGVWRPLSERVDAWFIRRDAAAEARAGKARPALPLLPAGPAAGPGTGLRRRPRRADAGHGPGPPVGRNRTGRPGNPPAGLRLPAHRAGLDDSRRAWPSAPTRVRRPTCNPSSRWWPPSRRRPSSRSSCSSSLACQAG
jgi:ABC-type nitrate/sulfonate/bicarbonate transport system permease component